MKQKFNRDDFYWFDEGNKCHLAIEKEFENNPNCIEPPENPLNHLSKFLLDLLQPLPDGDPVIFVWEVYPVYRKIKFPSGNYNFFHFWTGLVKDESEKQLPTLREQVRYLEEGLIKFNYWIVRTPILGYLWKPDPDFDKETVRAFFKVNGDIAPKTGAKYTGDLITDRRAMSMSNTYIAFEEMIEYKKALLTIEEKYSIPPAEIKTLEKSFQKQNTIESIQWLQSERQLAWLIEQLADQGYIKSENKWVNAVKHFVNKEGKVFKADSLNSKAAENRDLPEKNLSIPLQKIQNIVKKIPSNKE